MYSILESEVVVDIHTRLMWPRKDAGKMNWQEAMHYPEECRVAGFSDWRLPTIQELESLVVAFGETGIPFGGPGEKGLYWEKDVWIYTDDYGSFWSSGEEGYANVIFFNVGQRGSGNRNILCNVRCVGHASFYNEKRTHKDHS